MNSDELLYDRALAVIQSNTTLYDQWENYIAIRLKKKWAAAFLMTEQDSGSEHPTVIEVADMGAGAINNQDEFISDLQSVLRALAKGNSLNGDGNWC